MKKGIVLTNYKEIFEIRKDDIKREYLEFGEDAKLFIRTKADAEAIMKKITNQQARFQEVFTGKEIKAVDYEYVDLKLIHTMSVYIYFEDDNKFERVEFNAENRKLEVNMIVETILKQPSD